MRNCPECGGRMVVLEEASQAFGPARLRCTVCEHDVFEDQDGREVPGYRR